MANKINNKNFVSLCLRGRGFTLLEIVVAIAILAMVILFAGSIFKSSIGSYRTASAQAEIMQKLRVITSQLDSDFKGLRKDAPMFIRFETDPNAKDSRFDQIMFFADGDFQSTRLYSSTTPRIPSNSGSPVYGNTARVYYGHSLNPAGLQGQDRIFCRNQHILTADPCIFAWPDPMPAGFAVSFNAAANSFYEHDSVALSQWQAIVNDQNNGSNNAAQIATTCFDNANRPVITSVDPNTYHLLMIKGIGSFSIQWGYYCQPRGAYFWWPSRDPAGNGIPNESDFVGVDGMGANSFGFYFNSFKPSSLTDWFAPGDAQGTYYPGSILNPVPPPKLLYPSALKFAFTLFDSRGVFKDGQTFTHIVYLGD